MTLKQAKPGDYCRICEIAETEVRIQVIRLGIVEGSVVRCLHKLWGGPTVLGVGSQEIAIGTRLADKIMVEITPTLEWEGQIVAV